MDLDLVLLQGMYCLAALIAAAFFFQRYRWRRRRRARKSNWGFYPSAASMGNALHQFNILSQPQLLYVLEEKLNEESDEADAGGPEDPVAHLHRHTARLRRGEKLDRLTAIRKR